MELRERTSVLLHLAAGGLLAGGSLAANWFWKLPPELRRAQLAVPIAGLAIMLLGLLVRRGAFARLSAKCCLSVIAVFFVMGALEGFFRLIGFDFAREEEHSWKFPICFRHPLEPTGEVYFRRLGPAESTGQVLRTWLTVEGISPNPYVDEPAITAKYDKFGFRNEGGFSDWEIAVGGDSFTELGYLPYEQLFTTILGQRLNLRVYNCGVSHTGPLTQLHYLSEYGVAPSTRLTVIVFFEGNDLADFNNELELLAKKRLTGQREYRAFKKRTSMLRWVFKNVDILVRGNPNRPRPIITAHYLSPRGEVPVSLHYAPPGRSQIPAETLTQLDSFFGQYSAFGKQRGVAVWLAYMPCKERVLNGRLVISPKAPEAIRTWAPTDLPQVISELATKHQVRFIDLTPALVEETRKSGELMYNAIYDSHLNARGSAVVAEELARQLRGAITSKPGP